MNTKAVRANRQKLVVLAALVLLCAAGYMLVGVHFDNAKLFQYAMKIRFPSTADWTKSGMWWEIKVSRLSVFFSMIFLSLPLGLIE